jgi:hypothetical protein
MEVKPRVVSRDRDIGKTDVTVLTSTLAFIGAYDLQVVLGALDHEAASQCVGFFVVEVKDYVWLRRFVVTQQTVALLVGHEVFW